MTQVPVVPLIATQDVHCTHAPLRSASLGDGCCERGLILVGCGVGKLPFQLDEVTQHVVSLVNNFHSDETFANAFGDQLRELVFVVRGHPAGTHMSCGSAVVPRKVHWASGLTTTNTYALSNAARILGSNFSSVSALSLSEASFRALSVAGNSGGVLYRLASSTCKQQARKPKQYEAKSVTQRGRNESG